MPSLTNQNLNRAQNHETNALKKKGHFKDVTRGDPWAHPSHEAKFKQDAKPRSKHSGEDVIYGMGGLIRT